MSHYNYQSVFAWGLRVGDEMRAADGTSWLPPITRIKVPMPQHQPVLAWTRSNPSNTNDSNPDHKIYQHSKLRIRRPKVSV